MQYLDERLYIVTTDGSLACIDASSASITQAQEGSFPSAKSIKAPKATEISATTELESAKASEGGVIVKCFKSGAKLRVRVISEGYNKEWNVQFPQNLRVEGQSYIIEKVQESNNGGFYRAYGDIKKLEE